MILCRLLGGRRRRGLGGDCTGAIAADGGTGPEGQTTATPQSRAVLAESKAGARYFLPSCFPQSLIFLFFSILKNVFIPEVVPTGYLAVYPSTYLDDCMSAGRVCNCSAIRAQRGAYAGDCPPMTTPQP